MSLITYLRTKIAAGLVAVAGFIKPTDPTTQDGPGPWVPPK